MKKLILIGGTMGVGKSTVSQILKRILPDSVFLDGDWCWDSSPFQVTDETKKMVMDNICFLLNGFLSCSAYQNVIFCWVMHEQANVFQVCLDSGAKKVLLPIISAADLALVPAELIGRFNLIFYQSAEDAVFKALGVE